MKAPLSAAAALLAACTGPEVYVENDALYPGNGSDRNYTSGVRLDSTLPAEEAAGWYRDLVGGLLPWADAPPTPSVDREPFVGDLLGGVALQWGSFRLSYTAVARSAEFEGRGASHVFGSLHFGWTRGSG